MNFFPDTHTASPGLTPRDQTRARYTVACRGDGSIPVLHLSGGFLEISE